MPNAKLYMPSAPGILTFLLAMYVFNAWDLKRYVPKQCKCKKAREKPAMNGIYTKEHFGTCRTGQGLTDGKNLLVLEACQHVRPVFGVDRAYHWFIDPSKVRYKFLVKLRRR